jgi:energy-coupling factor transporter transmembrane protein EcfT
VDIAAIDSSATLGRSWLHLATPVAKLWAFAFVLTAAIVSWNFLVLASITIVLLAVSITAHLRPGLLLPLALYPAVFAAVFAFSAAPDVLTGITIVLKAVTAALAAIMLVLSTPYPQVFAPLQRLLPVVVGDALLMTYRSLFLLLDKFGNLLTAVRLRSGFATGQPVRSAKAATRALGGVLLYAIDLSQRDHDIMRLRGYEGRLRVTAPPRTRPAIDAALVAGAFLVAASSVGWRVFSADLNPFSWLAPVSAFALLLLAFIASRRTR